MNDNKKNKCRISVYAGPAGSGKTYMLSQDILKEAHESGRLSTGYIYITPDQCAGDCEKRLLRINRELFDIPGLLNVDVLGMGRFAHKIFAETDVPSSRVLEEFERSIMVRASGGRLKNSLKLYKGSIDKPGFINEVKSTISEFMQFGISPDEVSRLAEKLEASDQTDALAVKLKELSLIYTDMKERFQTAEGSVPQEERLKILADILLSDIACSVDGATVIFDDFRGFTFDQYRIISALMTRAAHIIFTLTIDTEIITSGRTVGEYELMYKSYETLESLKAMIRSNAERGISVSENEIEWKLLERGGEYSRYRENTALSSLEENIFRFPIKEFEGDRKNSIAIWRASSQRNEAAIVAEEIRRYVKNGGRYKDVAVITADLDNFIKYGEAVFKSYDIPVFCDVSRSFSKNPFTDAILKLLELIDRDFNYDTVFGFLKLGLIKPLKEIPDSIEKLENLYLRYGWRGRSRWSRALKLRDEAKVSDEMREEYLAAEPARKIFMDTIRPVLKLTGKARGKQIRVNEMTEALKILIGPDGLDYETQIQEAAGSYGELGMYAEQRAYESMYAKLTDMLDSVGELLGEDEMSVHEFYELISMGMNDMKLGVIPPVLDSVIVGDPDRTRPGDVKLLFFINMNEGILMSGGSKSPLLSDRDKEKIENTFKELGLERKLAPGEKLRSYMEQFYIYHMLSKPSERLILSFADTDRAGKTMEKSYVLGRIEKLFPGLRIEKREPSAFSGTMATDIYKFTDAERKAVEAYSKNDEASFESSIGTIADYMAYAPFDMDESALDYDNTPENIPQSIMKELSIEISVSKLEAYAGCPYSFFMRYIMNLGRRQESRVESVDIGNIMHRALEITAYTVKEKFGNDWAGISETDLMNTAGEALKKAVSENEVMSGNTKVVLGGAGGSEGEAGGSGGETGGSEGEAKLIDDPKLVVVNDELSRLMYRTVDTLRFHIVSGDMLPQYFEQSFTARFSAKRPDGTKVPIVIRGKVDRIDTAEDQDQLFVRIIDYKTSGKDFDPVEVMGGTQLQLPVYMNIISEILKKKADDKTGVVPAGMYYYPVQNPEVKNLTKKALEEAGGDSDAAAVSTQRDALVLKGAVNDDSPNEHGMLTLQERDIVNQDGSINKGRVIPIKKPRSNAEGRLYASSTSAVGTELLEELCEYSRDSMKSITEDILTGRIAKNPVRYEGRMYNKCSSCDYKAVCRFNRNCSTERVLSAGGKSSIDLIRDIAQKVKDKQKGEQSQFYDEIRTENR